MHNSDLTPQGVENRNILLWFKCVLTSPLTRTEFVLPLSVVIKYRERDVKV